MRSRSWMFLVPSVVLLAAPLGAAAQRPSAAARARVFDPATVRTVSGEIAEVRTISRGRASAGVHLTLATGQDRIDVHLGPEWFVKDRLPQLAKGDQVEVKGSEVQVDGKPALIAQEIRRGDVRVVLRDDAGIPAWSRGGRR